MYQHQILNGKDIYTVESHHHVLLPWSIVRRQLDAPPNLITLDHHPDTMPAFNLYRCMVSKGDDAKYQQLLDKIRPQIDWRNDASICRTIKKLKYDEHIHAATLAGIIRLVFSINLNSTTPSVEEENYSEQSRINWERRLMGGLCESIPKPQRPFTYNYPEDGIFEISSICAIGCTKQPHDDDCQMLHYE